MPPAGGFSGDAAEMKRREVMAAQMQQMMKAQQAAGGILPGMEHVMSQMHGISTGHAAGSHTSIGARAGVGLGAGGDFLQSQSARTLHTRAPVARAAPAAHMEEQAHWEWPEPEPGSIWEVIGGEETGGIIVRAGRELTSPQEKKRLSTSALIREEELIRDRLRYTRVTGSGPLMGWVSLTIRGTGKPLVMKIEGPGGQEGHEAFSGEEPYGQYGHSDVLESNGHWNNHYNQEEASSPDLREPEPPPHWQPLQNPRPESVSEMVAPEPAPVFTTAPQPAPAAPVLTSEPEDQLAWLRRLLEKAEMPQHFEKAAEWVAETGCEESDMRSGEGVEELVEHLELKKFPANRLRKAVKALQDEPPAERAPQPAAAQPPASTAPPRPAVPEPAAAAPAPAPAPAPAGQAVPALQPLAASPELAFRPPPRVAERLLPQQVASAAAAPTPPGMKGAVGGPSASKVERVEDAVPVPSIDAVLAKLERDAAEEAPEVPDLNEVLAAIERDAQEEAELEKAAEARADFFKLTEETTVSVPGPKQWWQESVLRLDGPKFNFAAASVLGRQEYLKTQPDFVPGAERPTGDLKPPPGWFKSRPGLEERLASSEVARGARRAARAAKGSQVGSAPAADAASSSEQ